MHIADHQNHMDAPVSMQKAPDSRLAPSCPLMSVPLDDCRTDASPCNYRPSPAASSHIPTSLTAISPLDSRVASSPESPPFAHPWSAKHPANAISRLCCAHLKLICFCINDTGFIWKQQCGVLNTFHIR